MFYIIFKDAEMNNRSYSQLNNEERILYEETEL